MTSWKAAKATTTDGRFSIEAPDDVPARLAVLDPRYLLVPAENPHSVWVPPRSAPVTLRVRTVGFVAIRLVDSQTSEVLSAVPYTISVDSALAHVLGAAQQPAPGLLRSLFELPPDVAQRVEDGNGYLVRVVSAAALPGYDSSGVKCRLWVPGYVAVEVHLPVVEPGAGSLRFTDVELQREPADRRSGAVAVRFDWGSLGSSLVPIASARIVLAVDGQPTTVHMGTSEDGASWRIGQGQGPK